MRKSDDDISGRDDEEVLQTKPVFHSDKEIEVRLSGDPLDADAPRLAELADRRPQEPNPDSQFRKVQHVQAPVECHQVTVVSQPPGDGDPECAQIIPTLLRTLEESLVEFCWF